MLKRKGMRQERVPEKSWTLNSLDRTILQLPWIFKQFTLRHFSYRGVSHSVSGLSGANLGLNGMRKKSTIFNLYLRFLRIHDIFIVDICLLSNYRHWHFCQYCQYSVTVKASLYSRECRISCWSNFTNIVRPFFIQWNQWLVNHFTLTNPSWNRSTQVQIGFVSFRKQKKMNFSILLNQPLNIEVNMLGHSYMCKT